MTDENDHFELAQWLTNQIYELADRNDIPPYVQMQATCWIAGDLMRHSVPLDMRGDVRRKIIEHLAEPELH